MNKANIGMIGMGVMGENLALNIESRGFTVSCYDIFKETIDKFISGRGKEKKFIGTYSLKEFTNSLSKPRIIWIMIKAGDPVDQTIDKLIPLLDKEDIIIDGGNSNFEDTIRRSKKLEDLGFNYTGIGVSGGEEGALNGPCLMPGGSKKAWKYLQPILTSIAAELNDGSKCCAYIGENGAGHYVKMVHNGIEYGDMQLICETYDIMRKVLKIDDLEASKIFREWNKGRLDSYLIEITGEILAYKDKDGSPLVENILDVAGQKGTGKWASISALNEGTPLTLITEAVYARCLSAMKDERIEASKHFEKSSSKLNISKEAFLIKLEQALYAAKILSYAQGFSLLRSASETYKWALNYGEIALIFRGGCIIRSAFLGKISEAYSKNKDLRNLILDDYFKEALKTSVSGLRDVIIEAVKNGVPTPTFSAALAYFDGYTPNKLPQNLLQAQRDYFGAHTYERIDAPRGKAHHTNWTGKGGDTTASTYNA